MTYILNVTTPMDLLVNVNTVTNGMFWPFMLIATFGIIIGTLKINNTWEESFASSTFLVGILGILLGIMSLITFYETIICIIMAFIGTVTLLWKRHQL